MDALRVILIIIDFFLGVGFVICFLSLFLDEFNKKIAIIGLLIAAIFIGTLITIKQIHIPDKITYIYSVKKERGIKARFCIFSGHVEDAHYYIVYVKEDGGYLLKKYPSERTYIFEDENKRPYVVEKDAIAARDHKYILHVPENTIISNYKLE